MAEANANIKFTADTSQALESIRQLQRSISRLYSDMARGAAGAQSATAGMQQNLINSVNATGQFTARLTTIRTTTESFTNALEKNKLSLGQYFKFGIASTERFGSVFKTEFNTIEKVARERVKDLQTQYIKMGRDASGAMKAIAVRPTTLDMTNLGTQTAIAAQKQQIFNQLLKQGTTNLLNFGKNTQWAGRQLMVGFTIPLSIFAVQAARSFQQLEAQAINFKRVYGDLFTTPEQTEMALTDMRELALEFTKLGVTVEETLALAAKVAQMGATGQALTAQVTEATRLSVLGQMEQQEALDTTIGITDAFGISLEDLTDKVNFLNAAENQTILSIQDFNEAVPRAGSVVAQLGGGVEDLAFFLTAMREGGIEASQGANALKTSLARLISPTEVAKKELGALGINIEGIVESNAGNLRQTVIDLALALDTLDPLDKSRAIEQLFGKFQFARMSALFQNIIDEGSQASTILDLMGSSTSELAALADRELGRVEASSATKFAAAIAQFNAALAPVGESFLKLATPIIDWATGMVEAFNRLGEGGRGFVVGFLGVIGGLAPVLLMVIGLVANLVANLAKGVGLAFSFFKGLGGNSQNLAEQTDYLTSEQIEAQTVAASLNQTHQTLIQTFTGEKEALKLLGDAYRTAAAEMRLFQGPIMTAGGMTSRPQTKVAGFAKGRKVPGYKDGVIEVPGPKGKGDIIPAMLAPGEAVIPAKMAQKYGSLINAMIAGNIPGYFGGLGAAAATFGASGSRPVEASHVEGRTPKELGTTMMMWIQSLRDGATANQEHSKKVLTSSVTVRMLGDEAEDGTRAVKTVVMSLDELSEYIRSNPTREFLTGGEVAGGTTIAEDREVNRAYNVVHPDGGQVAAGVPASLESASQAGKRAQEALDSQTAMSVQYRDGLLRLVERGKLAEAAKAELAESDRQAAASGRELTAEQKAVAQQQAFFRAREKEVIATRITAANRSVSNSQAVETAERLLADADERLAAIRASGIDDSAYLEKMESEYGSLLFQEIQTKSRKGVDVTIPAADIISVPAGQGRDRRFGSGRGSSSIVNESGNRATRGSGDLSARGASISRVVAGRQQELEAMGYSEAEAIVGALITGMDKFLKSSSPSERLAQTSKNAADGIDKGLQESIPELRQTGVELGEAVNDGAEDSQGATPGRRGNRRARMDETGTTDVMQGGEIIKTIYPPEVQQAQDLLAQVNLQNATKAQAFGDRVALVTTRITDWSGKVAMAGFALTSLLGAATQLPGPLGEIAGKAMPVIGAMTALSGVIRMVNAEKLIEAVRTRATSAALAFHTATTKVATSATVVNTLAKRGETVAAAQLTIAKRAQMVATVVTTGLLGGLAAAVTALLGPVGLIVLGLAALGIAVYAIVKAYQNEQARIEGLGNAAKLTGDQLKVLSDILGAEFRSSAFDTQAQAGASGAIEPEDVNAIAQLRDSEEFKEEFSGIISALRGATQDQATVMLEAQAAQLASLAKTEEDLAQIPFILRAQMEEAGVEGIDVEILIPDLTSIDGVAERVRTAIEPISNIGLLSGRALTEQMSITSGAISSTIVMLEQMRNTAVITPKEAAEQFALLSEEIDSIDDPGKKFKLMEGVIEDLQMDDLAEDIKDTDLLLSLIADRMQGIETPQDVIDLFETASKTDLFGQSTADPAIIQQAKDLALARTAEAAATRLATDAENELNAAKDIMTQEMAAANESIDKQIEDLSNQSIAYDILVSSGFSAAQAIAAVGDATLAAAIAGAAAGPELDALIERVQTLDALKADTEVKLGGRRGGGGGGTPTSVLDDVTKKLRLFNRAQTSVTKGWNASMKAILDFANASNALSGEFNGLNRQLRGIGLNENLIEMITGMDPDEYEKRKNELFVYDDKGSIVGMTAKLQSLNDAINSVLIGEFISTQEQLVNSVNNQVIALGRLTAAGASYEAAYRAVQNTALAAAIATARSSEMIRAAANAAMEAQRMMDKFATINEEEERRKNIAKAVQAINKEFSNQAKILDYINRNRSKLSEAQISEILTNKDLTALILEPSIDPGALATALDNANKQAQLELSIKKLTVEGQEQIFQDGLGKAMDLFNAEGNKIEFEFEASIKDQRKIIKDAEEQIALLDFELQTYQNDLKDIEFQEDEINKAYDKRFEALDRIAEANAEISRQQQAQLDVADALSRGDIAGAARAVREAREASGEVARERERKNLEQAQAAQLAALTSGRGLTREEAEARSLELEQQIFAIESSRLMPAEELVRLAELKKDADIESLEVLGKTREEYERIANAIDLARGNNWQSTEAIQEALNIVEQLIAELEKAKPIPVTTVTQPSSGGGGGGGGGGSTAQVATKIIRSGDGETKTEPFSGPVVADRLEPVRTQITGGTSGTKAPTPVAPTNSSSSNATLQPDQRSPLAKALDSIGIPRTSVAQVTQNLSKIGTAISTTASAALAATRSFLNNINPFKLTKARGGMIIPARMSVGGVARRSRSGPPLQMLEGGRVRGPGTDMSDSIPALLSNGEYVIRASAVRSVGEEFLDRLNGGKIKPKDKDGLPAFKGGGIVKKPTGPISIRQIENAAAKAAPKAPLLSAGKRQPTPAPATPPRPAPAPAVMTQDTRSPLKKALDSIESNFQSSGMQNYLPSPREALAGIGKFFFPATAESMKETGLPTAKGVLTDAALFGLGAVIGKVAGPIINALRIPAVTVPGATAATRSTATGSSAGSRMFPTVPTTISPADSTPQSVVRAALSSAASAERKTDLGIMLKNLEDGNIGPKETKLLDEITASVFVDNSGAATSSANMSGLDDVVRALAGDFPAQGLIERKAINLQNIIKDNISKNKDLEILGAGEIADPSKVTAIHSTAHPIQRDSRGAIALRPTGQYNPDAPRSSLHFTLEDTVKSHLFGEWGPEQQKIVTQLSSMMDNNGLPYNINPTDTWWTRSPGQELRLPSNAHVISPYTNLQDYSEELIKRGLLQPGKLPPVMAVDNASNEILHILKNTYSPVDRFQIRKIQGYTPRPGSESEDIAAAALKAAKERLGTSTTLRRLEDHGTTDSAFDESIRNLAAKLGVQRTTHSGSGPYTLEQFGVRNLKNVDSLDALRFAVLRGKINLPEPIDVDDLDDLTGLGGYVAKPTTPAFPRTSQSQAFLDEKTLKEIDIPVGTVYKPGVHAKESNFVEDALGKKYFVKGHAGHYLNDFETRSSFGYEFLAGRIGNLIGANTPQAYIVKRAPGKTPYQVATDAIPSASGLATKKVQDIIRSSPNPQKTLEDMLEAYAKFNETTPALNAVLGNKDLHRENIMWDNVNRKYMQIDMGTASPHSLKYPEGSAAALQGLRHPRVSESQEAASQSMVIVRAAINDAINEAIDLGLLNRPSQLQLAERARSLGFSLNTDNQSLTPLKNAFKTSGATTDLSDAYARIMNLDMDDLPSQIAQQLGLSSSTGVNNITKNLIETIKERASVLKSEMPRVSIGVSDTESMPQQISGYRMGGLIPYKANGGIFKSLGSDTVAAMLTPGEYVVRRSAVENFGVDNLEKINNGTYQDGSMYNYNLSINVKSESSPDQIARTVIDQIKRIDSQRIRGNRF